MSVWNSISKCLLNIYQSNVIDSFQRYLVLHIAIYDDDMYETPPSEPDLLQNMTYTVYVLAPQQFSSLPVFYSGDINENNKR